MSQTSNLNIYSVGYLVNQTTPFNQRSKLYSVNTLKIIILLNGYLVPLIVFKVVDSYQDTSISNIIFILYTIRKDYEYAMSCVRGD